MKILMILNSDKVFGYYGGKYRLATWLYQNFDLTGIRNYVEPFAGTFKVYLHEETDFSNIEHIVFNDLYIQNGNLFHCAQDPYNFLKAINDSFQPGGLFCYKGMGWPAYAYAKYRKIYSDYHYGRKELPTVTLSERNFEAALIYSFLMSSSMGSMHFKIAHYKLSKISTSWFTEYKMLTPVWNNLCDKKLLAKIARINEITAEDYKVVMENYNNPQSFLYIDPPYWGNEKFYDFEKKGVFKNSEHENLARLINSSNARIALSYYYFKELEDYYPKDKFWWTSKKGVWNSAGKKKSNEILIMNYENKVNEK
jgi:site-specific DNA-adenine methylase